MRRQIGHDCGWRLFRSGKPICLTAFVFCCRHFSLAPLSGNSFHPGGAAALGARGSRGVSSSRHDPRFLCRQQPPSATKLRHFGREGSGAACGAGRTTKGGCRFGGFVAWPMPSDRRTCWGIGQWTADMTSIFYFGEPDVWPEGDMAVYRALCRLTGNRSKASRATVASAFAPYRSFLALYLWRYLDGPD
jgi:hypothetical protein